MIRELPTSKLVIALAPLLLVTACGKSSGPQAGPTASGEILPGSVSDAMLDTDRSQAVAPLAPAAHSAVAKADAAASAEATAGADDTAAVDAPTPVDPAQPKPTASGKPTTP